MTMMRTMHKWLHFSVIVDQNQTNKICNTLMNYLQRIKKVEIIDKNLSEVKKVAKNFERFRMQPNWLYECPDFWHSSIAKCPRRTLSILGNWNYTSKTSVKPESLHEFLKHIEPLIEQEQKELKY